MASAGLQNNLKIALYEVRIAKHASWLPPLHDGSGSKECDMERDEQMLSNGIDLETSSEATYRPGRACSEEYRNQPMTSLSNA